MSKLINKYERDSGLTINQEDVNEGVILEDYDVVSRYSNYISPRGKTFYSYISWNWWC